jgi:mRNA interferase MazF
MTSFSRGDIVLVRFVFADEKGVKQRPGLVVSSDRYHQGRQETILAAITSNVGRLLVGDYKIRAWREAGLLYPSIVTGIVRTIKHDMVAGKMGELPTPELHSVEKKLRETLALPLNPRTARVPIK